MWKRITGGEQNTLPYTRWICGLGLYALAGCSGGESSSIGGFGTGGDEEGLFLGADDGHVQEGDIVATLQMEAPEAKFFTLNATIPVPPGTLTDGSLVEPLSLMLEDGRAIPTQVETVSRYPNTADGADVVRILARVRKPRGVPAGEMITYQVGINPHPKREPQLTDSVQSMLNAPGTIRLMTRDAFGHSYSADLLRGIENDGSGAKTLIDGHLAAQYRTHGVLLPKDVVDGPQGTLPHMMGVHSYITTWSDENFLSLDLHVHNGMDGLDQSTPVDDALGDLFFEDLILRLPNGWKVGYALDTDASAESTQTGGWVLAPIIAEHAGDNMHVMPQLSQFVRRLVIFRPGAEARAMEMVRSGFQAFVAEGTNPNGQNNWSWWNEQTARYYPQNHTLPNLEFAGLDNLRGAIDNRWNQVFGQITTGAGDSYPIGSPRLGWAHPWGGSYGGTSGGDEIDLFSGVELATTASRNGYRLTQLNMRCTVDRQPQALFDIRGDHTTVEDVLVTEGFGAPYADIWFNGTLGGNNDPFGFNEAPMAQNDAVIAAGRTPDYYEALSDFQVIDHQHYIRYTRSLKTLAWLGGDALAIELLRAAGDSFNLAFHQYTNGAYGHIHPNGLRVLQDQVSEFPGRGLPFGRGPAWGMDAAVAAYSMGDDEYRERKLPWMTLVADVLEEGQSTCTGNIMSRLINKNFDGQHRSRQAMEESFIENLLRSMDTSVYAGVNEDRVERLQNSLLASVHSTLENGFWSEEGGAPWFYAATGPPDAAQGDYCNTAQPVPNSDYVNRTAYYSSFAYAYQLDPDPEFLFRAAQMLGGGNLWALLDEDGASNVKNSAALIALCQMLGEDTL